MANQNQIKFGVGYQVDKSSVQKIKQSLKDLQTIKIGDFKGTREELDQVKDTAKQIEIALQKAFNVNIGFNTQKFNQELGLSANKVNQIYTTFSKAGVQGEVAFNRMASSILTTNLQLKETKGLLTTMGQTMVNTIKWGIASSVMNTFTNSIRQAVEYVKNLDSALTDIRIVTGDSTQKMKEFSVQANQAAQSLGRSTMDYTKAALTFYQQGLSDEDVQARTQSVLVAQNITGAGQEMADYLTAVWNGYKVANEEAELYVDKLAAVADSSASNMSQLAIAMSKVASTANMLGVPVDSLNAQIATIVATTRQAPESVGNALKTIYARINDIATGADDAQISLGNYSEKMAEVGISVLDANGRLRDTGDVIDEVGQKWATLSREQQIYLARTMAGQRQYNNLLALFENWGRYTDLVNVSMDAQGAAMEKNERYMDSLAAKMEQFGAAGERVKSALINQNDLKGLTTFGTGLTNFFANFIQSIGGGSNALLVLATSLTSLFNGVISKQINNIVTNIQMAKDNAVKLQQDVANIKLFGDQNGFENDAIKAMTKAKKEMAQYYSLASKEQINSYNNLVKQIGQTQNQVILLKDKKDLAEQYNAAMQQVVKNSGIDISEQFGIAEDKIAELKESLQSLNAEQISNRIKEVGNISPLQPLINEINNLKKQVGDVATEAFTKFSNKVEALGDGSNVSANQIRLVISAAKDLRAELETGVSAGAALGLINQQYDIAQTKADQAKQAAQDYLKTVQQFASIRGIIDGISAAGRFASALNSLANLKNIWSNQNLSASQKFLQTLTNIGFVIPMLVSSVGKLNTITKAWSASLLTGNKIQAAQTALATAQATVEEAHNKVIEKQKKLLEKRTATYMTAEVQQNAVKIATSNLEKAERAETNAIREQTAAQQQLNAAQKANPIGLIMTIAATAIFAAVKAYDAFTMSAKEAAEAIQTFNQKQKQVIDHTENFAKGKASLEQVREEYEELATKAGAISFDSNIDDLTQAERARYNEIKQLVKQYNDEAVVGYNKQGQYILDINQSLQDQIKILQKKHQAEIDATYSGPIYQQAEKARKSNYERAVQETTEEKAIQEQLIKSGLLNLNNSIGVNSSNTIFYNALKDIIDNTDKELLSWLDNYDFKGTTYADKFKQYINQILFGEINISDVNFDILKEIFPEDLNDNSKAGYSDVFNFINSLETLLGDYQDSLFKIQSLEQQSNDLAKFDFTAVLGKLQLSDYTEQYKELSDAFGQSFIMTAAKNYTDMLDRTSQFETETDVAEQIKNHLFAPLLSVFSEKSFSELQNQISEGFEALGNIDSYTYKEYQLVVKDFINNVISENKDLQLLAQENPKAFESIIKTLFNINIGSYDINNGRIYSFNSNDLQTAKDAKIDAKNAAIKWVDENFQDISPLIRDTIQTRLNDIIEQTPIGDLSLLTPDFFNSIDFGSIDISSILANSISAGGYYDFSNILQAIAQVFAQTINSIKKSDQALSQLNLLGLLGNKDNLNDDQLVELQEGLNKLIQTYPELTDAVQILNNEQLEGTRLYQKALEQVTDQILTTAEESLRLGADPQELAAKILPFVTNIEILQNVYNRGLLTNVNYSDSLIKIASNYESCADELNKYLFALQQGDQELIAASQMQLTLAARAEESGQKYGISAERISQLSKHYVENAEAYDLLNSQGEANLQVANDMAVAYIRLNDAFADLTEGSEEYIELLTQLNEYGLQSVLANEEMASSYENLRQIIAGLIGTDQDFISNDFIAKQAENLKIIAEGGENAQAALEQLQQAATEDIVANLRIDTSAISEYLPEAYQDVADWANNLPEGQLSVDDLKFANQLIWAMQQAGYAQSEIEAALDGMQLDVDLQPYVAGLNQAVDAAAEASDALVDVMGIDTQSTTETQTNTDTNEVTGYTVREQPFETEVVMPKYGTARAGRDTVAVIKGTQTARVRYPGIIATPTNEASEAQKQVTTTALMATNGRKRSGGNIKHSNRKTSTPKSGGGGGGSKGGGGSAKQPSIAKISTDTISTKAKQTPYNPYQEVEKSYERQEDLLKDLDELEKHLQGEDRLNNIQKQNKELIKQNSIIEERQKISEDAAEQGSTAWYRNQLLADEALKDVVRFDPDGQVNETVSKQAITDAFNRQLAEQKAYYEAAQNSYNNWIENVWNKYSGEQQQANKKQKEQYDEDLKNAKKNAQDKIKIAEEEYNDRTKLLENYQKALEEDNKFYEQYLDNIEKLIENRIAESKIKVDLAFDFGQTERQWEEFENKFIKRLQKDDIFANAKASFRELQSYFNSSEITQAQKEIDKVRKEIALIQSGQYSSIYGITQQEFNNLTESDRNNLQKRFLDQATKDLQDYQKKLMDSLEEVQDKQEEIQELYLDSIDKAKDKMDDVISQYERINDLVEHNIKLTELLYGDNAGFDIRNSYYNRQSVNNSRMLEALRQQQAYWQSQLNNATPDTEDWRRFKENLENVTDAINSALENQLDLLATKFENKIQGALANIQNKLTNGLGNTFLDNQWEFINDDDEAFLDAVNSKFGIDEVEQLYEDAAAGAEGNIVQQQRINKLMNDQLKALREKDKLTQYDIDRAKAALEVEKARMALEDARNNKTKMRLRRDSQGNYTYQYVADEEKLSDLQSALADAESQLYNMDKEHYKQQLNEMYDTYKDYLEKRADLEREMQATQDANERARIQARIKLLEETYTEYADNITGDLQYTLSNYLTESAAAGLGVDLSQYSTAEQIEFLKDNLPYVNTEIQNLADTITGEDGILNSTRQYLDELTAAFTEYNQEVQDTLSLAGTSVLSIASTLDDQAIAQTEKWLGLYQNATLETQNIIQNMQQLLEEMQKFMNEDFSSSDVIQSLYKAEQMIQKILNPDQIDENTILTGTSATIGYGTLGPDQDINTLTDEQRQALESLQNDYLAQQADFNTLADELALSDINSYTETILANADEILDNIYDAYKDDLKNRLIQLLLQDVGSLNNITSSLGNLNNSQTLDQNVTIEALFPNVTNHTEIEQALNNLVNMASQQAARPKP